MRQIIDGEPQLHFLHKTTPKMGEDGVHRNGRRTMNNDEERSAAKKRGKESQNVLRVANRFHLAALDSPLKILQAPLARRTLE